jgi:transcription antitermination factor NusG
LPNKDGEALPEFSSSPTISTGWFALYTSSRREKHVSKLLAERKIENFLPLYQAKREWKKRKPVTLELPLFPNYLFVRAGQKTSFLNVPGVLSIVGSKCQPWPLESHEIEAFRCAVDVCKLEPHPNLAVGERVRIRSGALAGMEGVLLRKKSRLRVILTIEVIQSSVAVEIKEADLVPVAARSGRDVCHGKQSEALLIN